MSYNYGTLLCNKLQIEYNGNAGIMSTITQTSKDSLYIDGPVIIGGDLTVSGTINGETGGGGGGEGGGCDGGGWEELGGGGVGGGEEVVERRAE